MLEVEAWGHVPQCLIADDANMELNYCDFSAVFEPSIQDILLRVKINTKNKTLIRRLDSRPMAKILA